MDFRHTSRGFATAGGKPSWLHRRSAFVLAFGIWVPAWSAMAAPVSRDTQVPDGDQLAYNFDSRLLLGSDLGVANIERFNKASEVEAGRYSVDIYLNDVFITRKPIYFFDGGVGHVNPCFSDEFLKSIGVLVPDPSASGKKSGEDALPKSDVATETSQEPFGEDLVPSPQQCVTFSRRVPGASVLFDMSRLRLELSVSQAEMKRTPRGFIDPANLDAGQGMAFVNYDANYYTSSTEGRRSDAFYLGISAGANFGLWHLRQQSAVTYEDGVSGGKTHWNNIRTYMERPLVSLHSKLVVGQDYTGGTLLSSVGYTGVHIESDDRMLPESMLGYAPVVNGVANTNARVVVSQNGNVIYQTTVPPGPFSINDLNPTSYQGDLTIQVIEANGQVSTFTVPFSAVPNSLRPGMSHYSATVGQVRQVQGSNANFADLSYERGLTNLLTGNGAVRVSSDYQSVVAGAVFGTLAGAFGLNVAWSSAFDAQGGRVNGWRASINYSHTIKPTMTTFTLAGYRYSTKGYRDFQDALSSRAAWLNDTPWSSDTYQQRDQVTLNVSQSFERYGSLALSGSISNYFGCRTRDTQMQVSYNNHYRAINYNLSFVRQQLGILYGGVGLSPGLIAANVSQTGSSSRLVNAVMATVTIPLGSGPRTASVSGSFSRGSDQGLAYQTSLSGVADQAQTLSYGLTASSQTRSGSQSLSTNMQKNLSMVTSGGNYSMGNGFWQAGANMRGAAVIHSGGLTLGPYLSDTFGVVEAKGAQGAIVRNGQGATVDRFGYAVIPSLTPYRFNDIALDSKGINLNAELVGNQIRVAPYAGASVFLKFSTLIGRAVLISASEADGNQLPLGADVLDSAGAVVGVVGQGGQIYARVQGDRGVLTVRWDKGQGDQCEINFDVTGQRASAPLVHLMGKCMPVRSPYVAATVSNKGGLQ